MEKLIIATIILLASIGHIFGMDDSHSVTSTSREPVRSKSTGLLKLRTLNLKDVTFPIKWSKRDFTKIFKSLPNLEKLFLPVKLTAQQFEQILGSLIDANLKKLKFLSFSLDEEFHIPISIQESGLNLLTNIAQTYKNLTIELSQETFTDLYYEQTIELHEECSINLAIKLQDNCGKTILHFILKDNRLTDLDSWTHVKALIKKGIDINGGPKHHPPLYYAAETGKIECIRTLLATGLLDKSAIKWAHCVAHNSSISKSFRVAHKQRLRKCSDLLLNYGLNDYHYIPRPSSPKPTIPLIS